MVSGILDCLYDPSYVHGIVNVNDWGMLHLQKCEEDLVVYIICLILL
jgi:hypothetical protein